ncbi:MAG TPA: sigma-70 family RNA polymerase sigma factor [Polyangiaceae bacterium]|nr:sigma-70 family RNA polymerase sigma factor [Polyangiaceae bacterium]
MARSSVLSARRAAPKRPRIESWLRPRAAVLRAVNTEPPAASNRTDRAVESERDRELIVRAQSGDEPAFAELVSRHQRRAFAIAFGLVRDEEDASEIVQEAFLRVYRGLDAFNGAASFFTWLYRIVKNLSIDLMRRPAWQRELADELAGEQMDALFLSQVLGADPEDALRRRELAEVVGAAIDALPSYHRAVILMREVEGMSYEEMASAAGVSKGTIMSRLFHARKKLQRSLLARYVEQTERLPPEGG